MTATSSPGLRVAALSEIPQDRFLIVDVEGLEVGLVRIGQTIYAVRNSCPHHGAPICKGHIAGTMLPSAPGEMSYGLERQVIVCPWHQYEFDMETGAPLFTNLRGRVRTYRVSVLGEDVFVDPGVQRR
jgi:nitrite reductase (NADH) small subunit